MITKLPALASRTSRRFLHHSSAVPKAVAATAAQPKWSGSLSYGTPEADFTALYVSANSATMESEWSQQLAFASPESDFAATTAGEKTSKNVQESKDLLNLQVSANSATVESEWAEQILLADAQQDVEQLQAHLESPSAASEEMERLLLQQMLLSCPESATGHVHAAETLTLPLKAQLAAIATPLPTTLQEALDDRRAIVVTTVTSPFRVVHVNESWEGLCGYTQAEAENQPIGDLLKGPETQQEEKLMDISQLQAHPETPQSALFVNYTKEGRKFHNRLSVGPLYSDSESNESGVQYLVGILQEVHPSNNSEQDGYQMAA